MSIICLVGKIKGLTSETYRCKDKINHSLKYKKNIESLVDIKKQLRWETRHHLLAYAFILGTPYAKLETSCSVPPDVNKISKIVQDHGMFYRKGHVIRLCDEKMKENIINWINGV